MNNVRHLIIFYLTLTVSTLTFSSSIEPEPSITLKFDSSKLFGRRAILNITTGREKGTAIVAFAYNSTEPEYMAIWTGGHFKSKDLHELLANATQQDPPMNEQFIPIFEQFFEKYSSLDLLEKGILNSTLKTEGKKAFADFDAEIDAIIADEQRRYGG